MKKNTIRGAIGLGVLLVLYILVAFLMPFSHTAVFWTSFVFTLIAFGVVAVSVYIAFVRKSDVKSRFYGFPVAKIGVIYGVAQFVLGFVFMALGAWIPVWVAVLVCTIVLGAVVIGLISAEAVVDEINVQDEKLKKNVTFMRDLQSKVNQMASQSDSPVVKHFAEEIRYSDPVSSNALTEIERELSAAVDELQSAIVDGDTENIPILARKASASLAERNRLCKLNK